MTNELAILLDQPLDPNAIEIGRLIRNGANGNRCYLEAGYKLILTKESHAHGEWLIWLHDNAKALGLTGPHGDSWRQQSGR